MKSFQHTKPFACAIVTIYLLACMTPVLAAAGSLGKTMAVIPNANGGFSESALGDMAADAVREESGAEIAVVFSGDLALYLPSGDVSMADIEASFPLNTTYYMLSLSPAELKVVLEHGVSALTLTAEETLDTRESESDSFPQVSGITYRIDASAPVGERILSAELENGDGLELSSEERSLSAVLPEQALGLIEGGDASALGSVRDIFLCYLQNKSPLERPELNRIRILGAHANPLLASGPVILIGIIILICVVMAIPSILQKKKNPEARDETYLTGFKGLKNK